MKEIRIKFEDEIFEEIRETLKEEEWEDEEGLEKLVFGGLYLAKNETEIHRLKEYDENLLFRMAKLRKEFEQLKDKIDRSVHESNPDKKILELELERMEELKKHCQTGANYAIMKRKVFELDGDNFVLRLHEAGLRAENGFLRNTIKDLKNIINKLRMGETVSEGDFPI
jgi:hypothetical protein